MTKWNNKIRYTVVMVLCIMLNMVLSEVSGNLHLPVWLDVTGTALAALLLEPTAGLMVGLVNNFFLAIFLTGTSSLFYYCISAAVALIVGLMVREPNGGRIRKNRVFPAIVLVLIVSTLLSTLLTLLLSGGVSTSTWEVYYMDIATAWGAPQALSCLFGVFVIKFYDTLATAALVAVLYRIAPRSFKYPPEEA